MLVLDVVFCFFLFFTIVIYFCSCFYSSCALFLDFGFVMMFWYLLCVLFVGIIFCLFYFSMFDLVVLRV